ncbi:MAG: hypothetical protein M4579_005669 [Chaenotheca gracillima]|nr:MAG: hypothetical protein M4579_005669 [Chaenotheca gracillima]
MPPPRFFPRDEELGKRNDDHRPGDSSALLPGWSLPWRSAFRVRRRRGLIIFCAVVVLYLFVKGITFSPNGGSSDGSGLPPPPIPVGPPPRESKAPEVQDAAEDEHYYSGPIKFFKLPLSLRSVASTMGYRPVNRNVMFAAASLKSAGVLIPMACEMARWNRNHVHFVLQGREDLSLDAVKEINGVGPDCDVFWHDARPDYAPYSSDLRLKVTITAALDHMETYTHPQAVIIDGSGQEEDLFKDAIHDKARALGKTVVALPRNAGQNMMWITRLDSGSLKAWDKVELDILIHVPSDSLGNLKRLLKSLRSADYFSSPLPRLTIELPSIVDVPTRQYLEEFRWPPPVEGAGHHASQLTIRHRIPHHMISSEEASTRFFESFYPADPSNSHVLVLSPNTQLSPLYYHYLKYTLLEYKYASYRSEAYNSIFGIALDLPEYHLDGETPFSPPKGAPELSMQSDSGRTGAFLWQAPSSNAVYFGSSWMVLHDFLRNRFEAQHTRKVELSPQLVGPKQPPWTNNLLELMRLKGQYLLYPPYSSSNAFATVHNELGQPQEEFSDSPPKPPKPVNSDEDEVFTADPATYLSVGHHPEKSLTSKKSILSLLPLDGDLPEIEKLPALTFEGDPSSLGSDEAENYATTFRKEVGGCGERRPRHAGPGSVKDLFCNEDDEDDEEQIEDEETAEAAASLAALEKQEAAQQKERNVPENSEDEDQEESEDPDTRFAKAEKGEGVMSWLEKVNQESLPSEAMSSSGSAAPSTTEASEAAALSSTVASSKSEKTDAPETTKAS